MQRLQYGDRFTSQTPDVSVLLQCRICSMPRVGPGDGEPQVCFHYATIEGRMVKPFDAVSPVFARNDFCFQF